MAFARTATVTAATRRAPALADGKRGSAATQIASLKCTPLDPVSAEVAERLGTHAAHELLQTFVDAGLDIREGDLLVVGSREYPIRAVGDWAWRGTTCRHLILEDLKR
jgi:hypothetical protein